MGKPTQTQTTTTVTGVPFSFSTTGSVTVTAATTSQQALVSRSGSSTIDGLIQELETYVISLKGQIFTRAHADHIRKLTEQIQTFREILGKP